MPLKRGYKVRYVKQEKAKDRVKKNWELGKKLYKSRKKKKTRYDPISTERLPKSIRPQECMHQCFFSKNTNHKTQKDAYPQIVEPKIDGIRAMAYIKKPSVKIFNRKGIPISSVMELEAELFQVINPKQDFFLDGELIDENFNWNRTWQRISTHDVKTIKEKYLNKHKLSYFVFDLVTRTEFDYPHLMPPLNHRKRRLVDWFEQNKLILKNVKLLPFVEVTSDESLHKFHQGFLKNGFEGTCIKNPRSKYESGSRGKNWRKIKPNETADLVVTDLTFGRLDGAYRHWAIASLCCEGYDPHTDKHLTSKVFQGIPWELRRRWRESPSLIMGKVIEVGYYHVSGKNKLVYPYFIKVREDKEAKDVQVNYKINFNRLRELEQLAKGESSAGDVDEGEQPDSWDGGETD